MIRRNRRREYNFKHRCACYMLEGKWDIFYVWSTYSDNLPILLLSQHYVKSPHRGLKLKETNREMIVT